MLRDEEEEKDDIEAEAKTWREWGGETECFGLVAKVILLCLIVVKAVIETV